MVDLKLRLNVSFGVFHDNVVVFSFVLLHFLSFFLEQFDDLFWVVLEPAFVFFSLLLHKVDEVLDQLVELLVERTDFVLRLLLEHFSDDFAVILVEANFTLENDAISRSALLTLMVALEHLRKRLLIPKFQQLRPRMVLKSVQVRINLNVRHDQVLKHSPRLIDRSRVHKNRAYQRLKNVTKNFKVVLMQLV